MFRVMIIDDQEEYLQRITAVLEGFFKKKGMDCEIAAQASPLALTAVLDDKDKGRYDLYLLDVEMPQMTGLELARAIRSRYMEPYIIFVTAHDKYSLQGYRHHAFSYVVKSRLEEMLLEALEDIAQNMDKDPGPYYVIEGAGGCQRIYYKDIYYMKVQKQYTYFHTAEGAVRVRSSLKNIYAALGSLKNSFIYVDQNCLVNIRHVMKISSARECVHIRNGEEIYVNSVRRKHLERELLKYWRESDA